MTKRIKYAGSSAGIPITPSQTLSESFGDVYPKYLDKDEDGKLMVGAETVVPYDPATGRALNPTVIKSATGALTSSVDNWPAVGANLGQRAGVAVNANFLVNKANSWESLNTPSVFKTVSTLTTAAGDTAVWTPAAGKKFRLLGFSISIDPRSTTAAGTIITLKDNATVFDTVLTLGTAATGPGPYRAALIWPSNGYLSSAADNVLNINLSGAFTAGGFVCNAWGTEE